MLQSRKDDAGFLASIIGVVSVLSLLVVKFVSSFSVGSTGLNYMAWVEDDFFYYAKIAQNFHSVGLLSFDGIHVTNGFQPFWMAVCVAVSAIFDAQSKSFFMTIWFLNAGSVVIGTVLYRRMLLELGQYALSGSSVAVSSTVYGLSFVVIGCQGMEVALLAPLLPLFVLSARGFTRSREPVSAIAVCACVTILFFVRLDSMVLIAPFAVYSAFRRFASRRESMATVVGIALAFAAPCLLYVALNVAKTGHVMPLSGVAKRLTVDGASTVSVSLISLSSVWTALNINAWLVPKGVTIAAVLGLCAWLGLESVRRSPLAPVFLCFFVGTVLFHLSTAMASDWQLWLWYYYGLVFVGALSCAMIFDALVFSLRRRPMVPAALAVMVCAVLGLGGLRGNLRTVFSTPLDKTNALFTRVYPLLDFASTHPGRYAMGDGAGVVGFLLPYPVVQLEGLVNDAMQISDIAHEVDLRQSLSRQGVDYYISSGGQRVDKCLQVAEPQTPGPRAPRMRATFCGPPLLDSRTDWIEQQVWPVQALARPEP